MFRELLPLLAKRSLILTVGSVKDDKIRVTVTPRPTSKDEAKEMSQPFVVEGTAEELDNELPKAIETYTGEILTLEQSIERLKASTAEALAAIKAENDKKVADAKKKPGASTTAAKTTTKPETKPEPVKPPAPPSLFDLPAEEAKPAAEQGQGEVAEQAPTTDDEDDPEPTPDGPDDDDADEEEASEEDTTSVPASVSTFPTPTVAAAQPSMFDEEEEILREAFLGSETDSIAA
jgi:PRTRC genetic system protein E